MVSTEFILFKTRPVVGRCEYDSEQSDSISEQSDSIRGDKFLD